MKSMLILFLFFSPLSFTSIALAQSAQDLKSLDLGSDAMPQAQLNSKSYIYQSRSFPLKNKIELSAGAAQNISNNGFLSSRQVSVGVGYHLNDAWAFRLQYAKVDNKFTDSAEKLFQSQGVLPEIDYAKSRLDISTEYSLFYGKFRFGQETVNYFDVLATGGVAQTEMSSGSKVGPVLGLGMAFWTNPISYRLNVRDYIHQENNLGASQSRNNFHAGIELGYVF